MASSFDAIIIGGGFAGLGTAWHLLRAGRRVLLLESAPELGGLVASYRFENYRIEKFYHHFFPFDREIFEVAEATGVRGRIHTRPGSVGYYTGGHVYPLDTPLQILRFPALSLLDKARLARLVRATKALTDADLAALDRVAAVDWIRQQAGVGVLERFFGPLLRGKFGEQAGEISAAWLAARVRLRSGRSLRTGEQLCYMEGGYETLVEALEVDVRERGEIHLHEPVAKILVEDGRVRGVRTGQATYEAPVVVAAVTPPVLVRLAPLPEDYARRLGAIAFQASTCVLIGVRKPLLPVYWLNLDAPSLPFDLMLEHNLLWPDPSYDVRLIYLASYHSSPSDPEFLRPEDEVIESYLEALARELRWNPDDLVWARCAKGPLAGPIYRMGYLEVMPTHDTPVAGLWHASMAHSFPERSVADSLRQARIVFTSVQEYLS